MQLLLASGSPRRRDLLSAAGLDFEVVRPDADETWPSELSPEAAVVAIAERKLEVIPADARPTLTADTIVWHAGEAIGKPRDRAHAAEMVGRLAGQKHTVFTGFCIRFGDRVVRQCVATDVWFRPLERAEIERYVATGEGDDKAGSYALQGIGAGLVERIDGSYTNVIGLPVREVLDVLRGATP